MMKKMLVAVMALAFFGLATMSTDALARRGADDPRPICRGGADDCIPHP
jgi:hypothetical protein